MSAAHFTDALVQRITETTGRDVSGDTPLVEGQVLDSMGLIELVGWVEEAFSVSFDAEELEAAFATVGSLGAAISARSPQAS